MFGHRTDGDEQRTMDELAALARPLAAEADLDPLMERIGDARLVLLGEASHGTSEFYAWRDAITRRLVREKGFAFVAVEGDWPDCRRVDRYVKLRPGAGRSAYEVLHAFDRWPTWMWANREVESLVRFLRDENERRGEAGRVGFYGLDVYSLWDSLRAVRAYLREHEPESLPAAERAFACFEPFGEDPQEYAASTRLVPESCEGAVLELLRGLREARPEDADDSRDGRFDAEQNALVARNAEAYYRAMVRGGPGSWNLRDTHMMDTLDRLLEHHGPDAKGVVWAHNTHVGDARATDMEADGMTNLGQLARERHGMDDVVIVGFGSHRGSVIAGRAWDAPMERMDVPPASEGSVEDLLHRAGPADMLLLFEDRTGMAETLLARSPLESPGAEGLLAPRGHRAIGVVYRPQYERFGNYVPTVLPLRYDAFLYVDETRALRPLHLETREEAEVPETFPSGM